MSEPEQERKAAADAFAYEYLLELIAGIAVEYVRQGYSPEQVDAAVELVLIDLRDRARAKGWAK